MKCGLSRSCFTDSTISLWNIFIDEKYYREPIPDEDFLLTRENYFEVRGTSFIEAYKITNYLQISAVCNISYGKDWIDFDEVEIRAFEIAVNNFNVERNKAANQKEEQIMKQFEGNKVHQSGFAGVSMPNIAFR